MKLYHGTKHHIVEFKYHKIGEHGTDEGYGFYFTDQKELAERFSEDGYLLECEIDVRLEVNNPRIFNNSKSISNKELNFTLRSVAMLIQRIEDYEEGAIIYNYGDPMYIPTYELINNAARNELECNLNDIDVLCSLCNSCGSKQYVLKAFVELFGQNCIKISDNKYTDNEFPTDIYVVFDNGAITISNVIDNRSGVRQFN